MKNNLSSKSAAFASLLLLPLLLWYCTQEQTKPAKGEVSFAFSTAVPSSSGRVAEGESPAYVKYTVENASGESIINTVPVITFGSSYTSERESFPTGHYVLKEYFVLNSSHEVLFAAVLAGAPLSGLVEITLPLSFEVTVGQTTLVAPDVLPVLPDSQPEQFGYVKWSFNVAAALVKFILPVHSDLISNYSSATLKITQGSYTHTEYLQGPASAGLYTRLLVKRNTPVVVSLMIDMDDILINSYNQTMDMDILYKHSSSQFEFTQTLSSIPGTEFTFPEFRHKIGKGWTFKSAEITTNGKNGSWIKIKYRGDQLCSGPLTITSNAGSFENYWNETDKMVWSELDYDYENSLISATRGRFGEPVCGNGICTLSAKLDYNPDDPFDGNNPFSEYANKYSKYGAACGANEWIMMDSWTVITTYHDGQKNLLNAYFIIEKDTETSSSRVAPKNPPSKYDRRALQ